MILAELVKYVYEHDSAGVAVLVLIKPDAYAGREDFEEALANVLATLVKARLDCTTALVANEPIRGVQGVPVVTLGLYPSIDDVEREDAGLGDLERGYQ